METTQTHVESSQCSYNKAFTVAAMKKPGQCVDSAQKTQTQITSLYTKHTSLLWLTIILVVLPYSPGLKRDLITFKILKFQKMSKR